LLGYIGCSVNHEVYWMSRLLVIGLDGFESSVSDQMIARDELPNLAHVRASSARYLLEHGRAKRTGLAWEHFSSGLSPDDGRRWSVLNFDSNTYHIKQEGARFVPFTKQLSSNVVVFDAPYFDLAASPNVRGLTNWGAHDPGVPATSNPEHLFAEMQHRFGGYPAADWIYGFAWPSSQRCTEMGELLTQSVKMRTEIACWLLGEKMPDWELSIVVVSETHSALEALWHGFDAQHPLHHHESATAAGKGLADVYRATDQLIGTLHEKFPDATLLLFNMHGMGPNESDVASMALLPELLNRHFLGKPAMYPPDEWGDQQSFVNLPERAEFWDVPTRKPKSIRERLRGKLQPSLDDSPPAPNAFSIDWMPAARLSQQWSSMPAFALPSYYDGAIRVNLAGREKQGTVQPAKYQEFCGSLAKLLRDCKDPRTGKSIVHDIEYLAADNPLNLDASAADMLVVWSGPTTALVHPDYGVIGPYPYRRTGGHTGQEGFAYLCGDQVEQGDRGVRSAFDVVPTIFELLGESPKSKLSGQSLLRSSGEPCG
jgi:predicted AlkP superfamily phosphohydrolase/phosphomutase